MKQIAKVKKSDEQVAWIPPELIRRFKRQPRKRFTEEDIDELAQSINAIDQLEAAKVRRITGDREHPYELVNGERRWRACTKLGRPLKCIIAGKKMSFDEQFMASVTANFGSQEHTPMEIANAIGEIRDSERFKKLGTMEKLKQLTHIFVKSEPWVRQYLSLLKLDPKVQARLDPNLPKKEIISLSVAVRLAFLPPEQQIELADKIVSEKLTLRQVNLCVRKMGQGAGIAISNAKRDRLPSDDFRILRGFVVKIRRELEIFGDPFVLDQLRKRSRGDLTALAKDLKSCAKGIEDLAAAILVPGKSPVLEKPAVQASAKGAKKPSGGKSGASKDDSEESDELLPTPADILNIEGAGSLDEDPVAEFEAADQEEGKKAARDRRPKNTGRRVVADECCLGGRDTVKACTDVLTVLGYEWGEKQRQFASREMKVGDGEQSIYVKYSENGSPPGEQNKEAFFYGPYIVFGKFFPENSVRSDDDYLRKRQEIKEPRIRKFYPVDIKKYKMVFQKWCERYWAKKKAA